MNNKKKRDDSILNAFSKKKIFITTGTIDFRVGIDMLSARSTSINQEEFFNGALFVYCSKARNQIRMLFWEGCGVWMLTRKINKSKFFWPNKNSNSEDVLACYEDLKALLSDPISWDIISSERVAKKLSTKGR
jgi:transposase